MWLPWDLALWAAAMSTLAWFGLRRRGDRWAPHAIDLTREGAILLVTYAAWRRMGETNFIGTRGAFERGRWIWDAERWLHLPNELTLQRWTMHATWLVRFANAYYIVCHVAPLGIFLVWLFVRHRDAVAYWRNQLAFVSIVCLAIQWIPVAPPRMYPQFGFVDTAARYGPRVYVNGGTQDIGQLAAMPSMHVAWAMLVGIAAVRLGTSRWKWLGAAHAALTVFAVTVTGYHWLADGIVATAVLLIGIGVADWWTRRAEPQEAPNGSAGNPEITMSSDRIASKS